MQKEICKKNHEAEWAAMLILDIAWFGATDIGQPIKS
jgi:hypothetical protein